MEVCRKQENGETKANIKHEKKLVEGKGKQEQTLVPQGWEELKKKAVTYQTRT